jgi:hypothetical protein
VKLKPVRLLLSLCYAGSAAAIGLGDIGVRSHLGQPLDVSVAILGAPPKLPPDCFSLAASNGSIAPPQHAQLSIRQSGGRTVLTIRTPRPINDPIVQFVLAVDCDARLQRDYVVLLDPPGVAEPVVVPDVSAAPNMLAAPGAAAAAHPVRRAKRIRPAPPAVARHDAAPRKAAAHPKQVVAEAPAPRLVLSGKHPDHADSAQPLQPGPDLPDRTLPGASNPTAAELSDDNTALSRRIADLEVQLAMLQKRNAELDARRRAASARVAPTAPERPPQWPMYLLAIGLLSGVGVLGNWLGRRHSHPPIKLSDDLSWVQSDSLPALPAPAQESKAEPAPRQMSGIATATLDESTEVRDDILDQAEVYMAHGHSELAVHLLQEHLREAPTESPVPWLLLLDLLHRAGDTAGYATASAECSRYFNVNLGKPPVSQDSHDGHGLEAYPHLLDQLTLKWNSPEIDDFFDDLIYDHRGGTRLGFEPGAYHDILLLRAIARDIMPLAA